MELGPQPLGQVFMGQASSRRASDLGHSERAGETREPVTGTLVLIETGFAASTLCLMGSCFLISEPVQTSFHIFYPLSLQLFIC